jgi:hypothetical protein
MSRGFDGFEVDDFRDLDSGSSRNVSRGSNSSGPSRDRLSGIHYEEERADQRDQEQLEIPSKDHSPLPREERIQTLLAQRVRTKYADRDKTYSLRDSEIHTLTEVGTFRVIAREDLAQFAYNGDGPRMENDLENLTRQGLVETRGTSVLKRNSRQVVTLTKQGQQLLRRHEFVPQDEAVYSGLVKPKEAAHDADLYRMYQKAADEIESEGGKVLRVTLDYELKEKLYKKLGESQEHGEVYRDERKQEIAREQHLPVVEGKVVLPDVRIEYETQEGDRDRVDLELATDHYRPQGLAEKASAGFQIYARSEDAGGLRRVRDDHEIMTAILRL